ncbi:MAG: hypothetical protein WDO18_13220 [Acidobacteriota bacterium]
MTRLVLLTLGALLLAAPAFSQNILELHLGAPRMQVTKEFGHPAIIEQIGDLESWRYQIGVEDNHEFSHFLVFRISTGELISATQNFEPGKPLNELFPDAETRVYHYPDAQHPQMSVRLRKLDGGRLLLAVGGKRGAPVDQLLLIKESELRNFHSWLYDQLHASE